MRNDNLDKGFSILRLAEESKGGSPIEIHCRKVEEIAKRLDEVHGFIRGHFVKWKPGLKNRQVPDYGEPVIVTAVLQIPIFDPSETTAASPYFQEPLSLVIGVYREDDLLEFRVDGRRFEPFDHGNSNCGNMKEWSRSFP